MKKLLLSLVLSLCLSGLTQNAVGQDDPIDDDPTDNDPGWSTATLDEDRATFDTGKPNGGDLYKKSWKTSGASGGDGEFEGSDDGIVTEFEGSGDLTAVGGGGDEVAVEEFCVAGGEEVCGAILFGVVALGIVACLSADAYYYINDKENKMVCLSKATKSQMQWGTIVSTM